MKKSSKGEQFLIRLAPQSAHVVADGVESESDEAKATAGWMAFGDCRRCRVPGDGR